MTTLTVKLKPGVAANHRLDWPADAVGEVVSTTKDAALVFWPHRGCSSVWTLEEIEAA